LAARFAGTAPATVAMVDAYRGEVYACVYDGEGRPVGPASVEDPAALVARAPAGAAFVGDGAERYRDVVLARPGALLPRRSLFLAATLGRMAVPRLARGEGGPPSGLRPLYLRAPDIRKPAS